MSLTGFEFLSQMTGECCLGGGSLDQKYPTLHDIAGKTSMNLHVSKQTSRFSMMLAKTYMGIFCLTKANFTGFSHSTLKTTLNFVEKLQNMAAIYLQCFQGIMKNFR